MGGGGERVVVFCGGVEWRSLIGNTFVSLCKCRMGVQPVAMRSALFCNVCSLSMFVRL